ncbi:MULTISPECIES: hypothetical protein [Oceanobacillus]|uniref:hypothetical protein n=1 Tax=Oceanobacillus TaxID=182709 RepID=UPI002F96487C
MEKIQLTQEQADVIERKKNKMDFEKSNIVECHVKSHWEFDENLFLNKLSTDELCRLLYTPNSYEIITEFKLGDWVINIHSGDIGQVEEIKKVEGALGNNERIIVNSTINYPHSLRHATPEEIQKEIECRWWNNHGREVWEIREGDILKNETHYPYFVTRGNRTEQGLERTPSLNCIFMEIDEIKSRFKVSCFVEQRLDK